MASKIVVDPAKKFLGFLTTVPVVGVIEYLQSVLGGVGVKVIYEKGGGYSEGARVYERITLGTFKRSSRFEFPGIVIEAAEGGGYRVVSVPSAPPMVQYRPSDLDRGFRGGKVIVAEDGTTVTLYYYGRLSRWVISTYRGFDVNGYELVGGRTYEEVVREVMAGYPRFSFDALDKGVCYTIGFNHPSIHPFTPRSGPVGRGSRAWFIRAVAVERFGRGGDYIDYGVDIGIPLQQYVKFSTVREMRSAASQAYFSYVEGGAANYGYIVRVGHCGYLVESSLLAEIRRVFYSNRFAKISERYDKRRYAVVSGALGRGGGAAMGVLFPQYAPIYEAVDATATSLVEGVMGLLEAGRGKGVGLELGPDVEAAGGSAGGSAAAAAAVMFAAINKEVTLESYETGVAYSLIRNYINNPVFTEVFYNLLFPSSE